MIQADYLSSDCLDIFRVKLKLLVLTIKKKKLLGYNHHQSISYAPSLKNQKYTRMTYQLAVFVLFSWDKSCSDFLPHSDLAGEVEQRDLYSSAMPSCHLKCNILINTGKTTQPPN